MLVYFLCFDKGCASCKNPEIGKIIHINSPNEWKLVEIITNRFAYFTAKSIGIGKNRKQFYKNTNVNIINRKNMFTLNFFRKFILFPQPFS